MRAVVVTGAPTPARGRSTRARSISFPRRRRGYLHRMGKLVVARGGCRPPVHRRFHVLPRVASILGGLTLLATACTSSSPTDPPEDPAVASLDVAGPSTLIVHEMALFEVTAKRASGVEIPFPQLSWDTSDSAVATVSESGVVTAQGRGQATIGVSSGDISAEIALSVTARVKITPSYRFRPCLDCNPSRYAFFDPDYYGEEAWHLPVGDTLHLSATYVDVDGVPLGEEADADWASSDPDYVSVSADGEVIALAGNRQSFLADTITASTSDGADKALVRVVADAVAGRPATLRLSNAAIGAAPVTFVSNKSAPVTLSFGESVDIPITSGLFFVDIEGSTGLWQSLGAIVMEDDHLSIYAVNPAEGDPENHPQPSLVGAWDRPTFVPDDSVRVRLIEGSGYAGVVYVLEPDAPADGLPELCYFDPTNTWGYVERPTGGIDFVMQPKYGNAYEPIRIRATPRAGQSVTYVIVGGAVDPPILVPFPEDP
jgi:hypothetical protein